MTGEVLESEEISGAHAVEDIECSALPLPLAEPSGNRRFLAQAIVSLCILGAMRLALMAAFSFSLAHQEVDDLLYLELGQSLEMGEWLGDYDGRNLIKEIGFPLFVAASKTVGLPLRISQELFWILSCATLYCCLRRLGFNWLSTTIGTGLVLFHPAAAPGNLERVLREHVYGSQTLAILSLAAIAITLRCWRSLLPILGCLSLLVVWTWHSREEGVWLVPILGMTCAALVFCHREPEHRRRGILAALLFVALTIGLDQGFRGYVRAMNKKHYGASVFVETKEEAFRSAVGAIVRAEQEDEHRYFPVHQQTLNGLYPISPTLASIKPTLDSAAYRDGWMTGPKRSRTVCALGWALREGARRTGQFESPTKAEAFFQGIADEVNDHLDQDKVRYGEKRVSVFPPLRMKWWRELLDECYASLRDCWRLDMRYVGDVPGIPQMQVSAERRDKLLQVLGQEAQPLSMAQSSHRNILRSLLSRYRFFTPWLAFAAIVGLVLQVYRERRLTRIIWVLGLFAVAVITRAVLISGLEIWYSPSRSTYLLCAMPPFMAAIYMSLMAGFAAIWPRPWVNATKKLFAANHVWLPMLLAIAGALLCWAKNEAQAGSLTEVPQQISARITGDYPMIMEVGHGKIRSTKEGLSLMSKCANPSINARPWIMVRGTERFDVEVAGRAEGLGDRAMTFVCYGEGSNFTGTYRCEFQPDTSGQFHLTFPLGSWSIHELYLGGPVPRGAILEIRRFALVEAH